MKRIWAPWRKEYIEEGSPQGCIFCDKPAGGDDRKNHIVMRAETCFCMLNRYPYNGGHLMVAPYRHVADLNGLKVEELTDLMVVVRDSVSLLKEKLSPDAFNIGSNLGRVAGAGVADHFHIHIVPRWSGDTNFMPVIAGTKVIPHSLDDMYRILTGSRFKIQEPEFRSKMIENGLSNVASRLHTHQYFRRTGGCNGSNEVARVV